MYSPITGTGSGIAPVVNLTFPFLDKTHVKVLVEGAPVPYTWTGLSQITFNASVPAGAEYLVYRDTPIDTAMVDFTDGSVLTAVDLDLANSQLIFRQQELQAASVDTNPTFGAVLRGELTAPTGASEIGWLRSAPDAVARTVADKLTERLNVKDFGAAADGVTDDTAAVQAAINAAASSGLTVHLPKALLLGALTVPDGVTLRGADTTITTAPGSYDLFTITGSDVTIENLRIEAAAKTGGYEFRIDTGAGTVERTTLRHIVAFNSKGGIADSGTGTHITTRIRSVQFRAHNGPGLSWTRGYAFLFLNEVTFDYVGVATANYTGFSCDFTGVDDGGGGVFFRDCDVLGTAGVYNNAAQRGWDIRNASSVSIMNSRADSLSENGFVFDGVNKLELVKTTASLIAGHGFSFTDVTNATGNDVTAFGRTGLTYAPAGSDGFRFIGGNAMVQFTGGMIRDMTGNGVNKVAAQAGPIDLRGFVIALNGGRGVTSVGNSPLHVSAILDANAGGDYNLGGASDYLSATMLTNGTMAALRGPGPISG